MKNHSMAADSGALDNVAARAWLRLLHDRRWTRAQKHALLAGLSGPQQIYTATPGQLKAIAGPGTSRAAAENDQIEADLRWCMLGGNSLLTPDHACWPELLNQISDPPLALFVRGNPQALQGFAVAMVGSRRPTPVGSRLAHDIARQLGELGLVIVSGMALGIDAQAHSGALAGAAATVAVMGSGVDVIYPRRNLRLSDRILEGGGCLVSEFTPGTPPLRHHFPQRNRIVSGLCHGVVIVEAAERSGTLITARLAMEQDREVMVLPGPALSPQYKGSHRLISQGAALIDGADSVLAELAPKLRSELQSSSLVGEQPAGDSGQSSDRNPTHNQLLQHVGYESTPIDRIISECGLTTAEVSSMLQVLEVEGVVARAEDGGYVKLV